MIARGNRRWWLLLVLLWALVISWSEARRELPAAWWMVVRSVAVQDAPAGTCPRIALDRTVRRPFRADWLVTLERQAPGGAFVFAANFSGEGDYRPENRLPDPLTLGWWTEEPACPWPPGTYRLRTLWAIDTGAGDRRFLRVTSEPFRLTD